MSTAMKENMCGLASLCFLMSDDSKMRIVSFNLQFPQLKAQHTVLRRKKAEPRTPHFLSFNQDIVAWF